MYPLLSLKKGTQARSASSLPYSRILVFAARPDDELAMAGTMAKLAEAGAEVYVLQMTDGSEGYPLPEMRDTIVSVRKQEALECNKVLGIRERVCLDEPDMGLQHSKEVVLKCLKVIRRFRPEAIFTHGPAASPGGSTIEDLDWSYTVTVHGTAWWIAGPTPWDWTPAVPTAAASRATSSRRTASSARSASHTGSELSR